ncbi:MAG: 2-phosphosulfolactate phosphatase [Acidimicrobiales bacterium]
MTSPRPASSHDTATWFEQSGFGIRFGWGPNDLRRLAPAADVVVIVDVLSFSTAVDVALGRGAIVLPYARHDGTEQVFADANDAVVASPRRTSAAPSPLEAAAVDASWPTGTPSTPQPTDAPSTTLPTDVPSTPQAASTTVPTGGVGDITTPWSLSPASLTTIEAGTRLVLPSPNGSALTFGAKDAGAGEVLVACLRNASATARACVDADVVAVIAAGERWRGATGPLRPALEDLLGAGAVIDALTALRTRNSNRNSDSDEERPGVDERPRLESPTGDRDPSPEAMAAAAAFRDARADLEARLAACGSGRELIDRGFGADVDLAAALDVSTVVAVLDGPELRPTLPSNRRRKPSPQQPVSAPERLTPGTPTHTANPTGADASQNQFGARTTGPEHLTPAGQPARHPSPSNQFRRQND